MGVTLIHGMLEGAINALTTSEKTAMLFSFLMLCLFAMELHLTSENERTHQHSRDLAKMPRIASKGLDGGQNSRQSVKLSSDLLETWT